MPKLKDDIPIYQQIKNHILNRIKNGVWSVSQRVPSENELVQMFGVSRMTANRVLRELTSEGFLIRVTGIGTFVAENKPHSDLLEIHNIADEIKLRGHEYKAQIIKHNTVKSNKKIFKRMELKPGDLVFHSVILHYEQNIPIQLEDRYVNKKLFPDYGKQDFTLHTPHEYLIKTAPIQAAEHTVSAVMPDNKTAALLNLNANEPCLHLKRRTWSNSKVATVACFYYPGSRYELSGRFNPQGD